MDILFNGQHYMADDATGEIFDSSGANTGYSTDGVYIYAPGGQIVGDVANNTATANAAATAAYVAATAAPATAPMDASSVSWSAVEAIAQHDNQMTFMDEPYVVTPGGAVFYTNGSFMFDRAGVRTSYIYDTDGTVYYWPDPGGNDPGHFRNGQVIGYITGGGHAYNGAFTPAAASADAPIFNTVITPASVAPDLPVIVSSSIINAVRTAIVNSPVDDTDFYSIMPIYQTPYIVPAITPNVNTVIDSIIPPISNSATPIANYQPLIIAAIAVFIA